MWKKYFKSMDNITTFILYYFYTNALKNFYYNNLMNN